MKVTKYSKPQSDLTESPTIDDMFTSFWNNWPSVFSDSSALDMYEEEGKLHVKVSMPHFAKKDISLSADNGVLEISAENNDIEGEKADRHYYMRESSSQMLRRVNLPKDTDTKHVNAQFKDGILHVTMPLTKPKKPDKIKIE